MLQLLVSTGILIKSKEKQEAESGMLVARRYLALLNSYRLKYLSRLPRRMTSSTEKEETHALIEVHRDSR